MTKLKLQHPDVKQTDLMVMAAKRWKEMLPAEKKPYDDMNAEDKLRQEQQQKFLDENGFFFLEDGSRSTDVKNIPRRSCRLAKANNESLFKDNENLKRKSQKKALVAKWE